MTVNLEVFKMWLFAFLVSVLILANYSTSSNILGLFPLPSKSHYITFDSLMVALAERGHNVTVYSTFPKDHSVPNHRDVSLEECFPFHKNIFGIQRSFTRNQFSLTKMSTMSLLLRNQDEILRCKPLLNLQNFADSFDLLITETFVHDFSAMFAFALKVPLILVHSRPAYPWMSTRAALPDNPAYIPHPFSDFSPKMDFIERLQNTLLYLHALYFYKFYSENQYDMIVPTFFGYNTPRIDTVVRNASLLFLNSHHSLNGARPMVPNVVEIGGLSIKPAKLLPKVCSCFLKL